MSRESRVETRIHGLMEAGTLNFENCDRPDKANLKMTIHCEIARFWLGSGGAHDDALNSMIIWRLGEGLQNIK